MTNVLANVLGLCRLCDEKLGEDLQEDRTPTPEYMFSFSTSTLSNLSSGERDDATDVVEFDYRGRGQTRRTVGRLTDRAMAVAPDGVRSLKFAQLDVGVTVLDR